MQIIRNLLSIDTDTVSVIGRLLPCAPGKACFFDIETTGLSPKISNVYLIGAAFLRDDQIELIQWFADDYTSEATLLSAFSEALSDCDTVIHYNGTTFDIPYLTKKYIQHGMPDPFLHLESLDLYREVNRFCKKYSEKTRKGPNIFHTDNLKLVTVERLLGFDRGKDFSGKECIQLYTDFMQEKFAHHEEHQEELKTALLSHNHDDLIGTCLATKLLIFSNYQKNTPTLTVTENEAVFSDTLPDGMTYPFPLIYHIHMGSSGKASQASTGTTDTETAGVTCEDDTLTLRLPLFKGELCHYFSDYKDYFYLPDEDMAVHKSVGAFVDKEHREPASAANCYVRKEGVFMPVPSMLPDTLIYHKKNAPKGACYIEAHSASDEMISFLL